ncbi:hypothetical protein VNO78_21592 [Psophocarpus tetragonolobus]|uniref:Uncharacterized protein n=1 Tax=Psophocarpus tetragonolobus TaxID=3891 RepID=A0AAN9SBB4_PSOTE
MTLQERAPDLDGEGRGGRIVATRKTQATMIRQADITLIAIDFREAESTVLDVNLDHPELEFGIALHAVLGASKPGGLIDSVSKRRSQTLDDFLERSSKYVSMEEALLSYCQLVALSPSLVLIRLLGTQSPLLALISPTRRSITLIGVHVTYSAPYRQLDALSLIFGNK